MSKQKGQRFVALYHWMTKTAAWKAATLAERCTLLDLWERYNGANNGQIVYAVRNAEDGVGIKRSAAAAALNGLVELGFLRIARDSAFTLKTKEARLWTITAEPINGKPATKDFTRWKGPRSVPEPPRKFKTQSAQTDRQSAQTDRGPQSGILIPLSVRPGGPWPPEFGPSQSAQTDTSISTMGEGDPAGPGRARQPPRFGDAAQAERTARHPNGRGDD